MTKRTKPAADEAPTVDTAPEQPSAGGSYVRREDGTLERVAFTAPPGGGEETPAEPADEAPASDAAPVTDGGEG